MEVNGSITVTCIFATGASSTGCQVTIFKLDSLQVVFLNSTNITHLNRSSEVNILTIILLLLRFTFDIKTYCVTVDAVRLLQTSMITKMVVTVILKVMIAEYE